MRWMRCVIYLQRERPIWTTMPLSELNRYISLARHNSLFCGCHEGADRCAIFYTLALTCRQNDINFYEYLTYVLEKTAAWQPSKDLFRYKELLPQNIDKEVLKKEKDRQ